MDVNAQLNGLRMAPRKVRLVVDLVKRKDVETALDQLAHMSKRAALPVRKVIASAIANAEHNFRMVRSNLYIKEAWVDEGVKLRRWQPKGFGRAAPIQKKISRVTIVLGERVVGVRTQAVPEPAKNAPKPVAEDGEMKHDAADEQQAASKLKTPTAQAPEQVTKAPKGGLRGFGKRLFRRKSI